MSGCWARYAKREPVAAFGTPAITRSAIRPLFIPVRSSSFAPSSAGSPESGSVEAPRLAAASQVVTFGFARPTWRFRWSGDRIVLRSWSLADRLRHDGHRRGEIDDDLG